MHVVIADNLPRVMKCVGVRFMSASLPPNVSDPTAREEGTAAHYMAASVFDGLFQLEELIDRRAPNGYYMTVEMAGHVHDYLFSLHPGAVEQDTSFGGDLWRVNGRCDHRAYDEANDVLHIDDFKYGHSPIEVKNNWTLIAHAIGSCRFMNIRPAHIRMTIHQPRAYHPDGARRSWEITYEELMNYYYLEIAKTLPSNSTILSTGPHCRHCLAMPNCPAARDASMNAVDMSALAFDDAITDEILAWELDTLNIAQATIKNRLDALTELAKHRVRNGAVVENYFLDHSFGHRRWKPGFSPKFLSMMTGKSLIKETHVTPKEAERLGVPEHFLTAMTERPQLAAKLVRRDADSHARKIFKGE